MRKEMSKAGGKVNNPLITDYFGKVPYRLGANSENLPIQPHPLPDNRLIKHHILNQMGKKLLLEILFLLNSK